MNAYDIFAEKDYLALKEHAISSIYDNTVRSYAIHRYKSIYGSTLRKLLEVCGKNKGPILSGQKVEELFKPVEHCTDEVIQVISCFVESYNDEQEYKKRQIPIKASIKERVIKKRFKAYQNDSWKELKQYQILYVSDKKKFHDMKYALIIYNGIMKTFFVRGLPKRLPVWLYEECIKCNESFRPYYEIQKNNAILTKMGRSCKHDFPGIYIMFGLDVTLQLSLFFLRINRK